MRNKRSFFKDATLILLLLILVHIILHVKFIPNAPGGFHLWRQTQGLAVARNFFEESMDISKPRVDNRGNRTGITGMEFPLINYLLAQIYQLFGFSHAGSRLLILFFSVWAIVFCYGFVKELAGEKRLALLASLSLVFSPLFGYYSLVMMPDIPMLALSFASLFFLIKWQNARKNVYFFCSLLFLLLAAWIKISALVTVFYYIYIIVRQEKNKRNIFFKIAALAGMLLLISIWYLYAIHISSSFGNDDFKLVPARPHDLMEVLNVAITVLGKWLPGFYLNVVQFLFFLAGLIGYARMKDQTTMAFTKLTLAGLLIYILFFYPMFRLHDYYMIPALPILTLWCARGMKWILELARARSFHYTFALFFLVVIMPVAGTVRYWWRFEQHSPRGLQQMSSVLDRTIPDRKKLVVACSDISPSIYLYFFHRRGWSITEKTATDDFVRMVIRGANYLVCDSKKFSARSGIGKWLERISSAHDFDVFKIQTPGKELFSFSAYDIQHFFPSRRITNAGSLLAAFRTRKKTPLVQLYESGLGKIEGGEYAGAAEFFKKIIQRKADDARAHFHLGYCLGMMGNLKAEIESYMQAINRNPADRLSFFNLSFALTRMGRLDHADDIFNHPAIAKADAFLKNFFLAMIHGQAKDYPRAIDLYQRAIVLRPDNELAIRNLGAIYCQVGRFREAIARLDDIVGLPNESSIGRYYLALACLREGLLETAAIHLDAALRLRSDFGDIHFYRGVVCFVKKSFTLARQHFLAAKRLNSKPAAVNYFLSLCSLFYGENDSAIRYHKEIRGINRGLAVDLFNLISEVRSGKIAGESLMNAGFRSYAASAF